MTNQIIEVPDIAVVKTVNGTKQLLSLRDQKIKKDGNLNNFCTGSGVKYQGNLYVLDSGIIPIVRMTTSKIDPSFSVNKHGDIEVDWGDGTWGKNIFKHTYTDGVKSHDVVFWGLSDSLIVFYCDYCELTSLTVYKNFLLEQLFCNGNSVTSLDVSFCPSLEWLDCSKNQIASLDVCNNPKLRRLEFEYNQLTYLNIEKQTELWSLYCGDNKLTSLDVSKNTKLSSVGIANNPMVTSQSDLIEFAKNLPDRKGSEGALLVVNNSSVSWIHSICVAKNWSIGIIRDEIPL